MKTFLEEHDDGGDAPTMITTRDVESKTESGSRTTSRSSRTFLQKRILTSMAVSRSKRDLDNIVENKHTGASTSLSPTPPATQPKPAMRTCSSSIDSKVDSGANIRMDTSATSVVSEPILTTDSKHVVTTPHITEAIASDMVTVSDTKTTADKSVVENTIDKKSDAIINGGTIDKKSSADGQDSLISFFEFFSKFPRSLSSLWFQETQSTAVREPYIRQFDTKSIFENETGIEIPGENIMGKKHDAALNAKSTVDSVLDSAGDTANTVEKAIDTKAVVGALLEVGTGTSLSTEMTTGARTKTSEGELNTKNTMIELRKTEKISTSRTLVSTGVAMETALSTGVATKMDIGTAVSTGLRSPVMPEEDPEHIPRSKGRLDPAALWIIATCSVVVIIVVCATFIYFLCKRKHRSMLDDAIAEDNKTLRGRERGADQREGRDRRGGRDGREKSQRNNTQNDRENSEHNKAGDGEAPSRTQNSRESSQRNAQTTGDSPASNIPPRGPPLFIQSPEGSITQVIGTQRYSVNQSAAQYMPMNQSGENYSGVPLKYYEEPPTNHYSAQYRSVNQSFPNSSGTPYMSQSKGQSIIPQSMNRCMPQSRNRSGLQQSMRQSTGRSMHRLMSQSIDDEFIGHSKPQSMNHSGAQYTSTSGAQYVPMNQNMPKNQSDTSRSSMGQQSVRYMAELFNNVDYQSTGQANYVEGSVLQSKNQQSMSQSRGEAMNYQQSRTQSGGLSVNQQSMNAQSMNQSRGQSRSQQSRDSQSRSQSGAGSPQSPQRITKKALGGSQQRSKSMKSSATSGSSSSVLGGPVQNNQDGYSDSTPSGREAPAKTKKSKTKKDKSADKEERKADNGKIDAGQNKSATAYGQKQSQNFVDNMDFSRGDQIRTMSKEISSLDNTMSLLQSPPQSYSQSNNSSPPNTGKSSPPHNPPYGSSRPFLTHFEIPPSPPHSYDSEGS